MYMWEKFRRLWSIKALRQNILVVIGMLVVFRLVAHIPIPGIDLDNLRRFLASNQLFGLLNIFTGGSINNFSLVTLGVGPYITASIIFQLLTMVVPRLEELSKEGEAGQQKINLYTRVATVPLALLQAFGFMKLLNQQHLVTIQGFSSFRLFSILVTMTAGTMFLVWIGEIITEKKVGNGVSLIIFAGIVASIPNTLQTLLANYTSSDLYTYIIFAALMIVTIVGVVLISEGQRNIPVQYAKQGGGRTMGHAQSHLPLRVNMAGVIPIIFAISIILFPSVVAQFFVNSPQAQLASLARATIQLLQNQLVYGALYFLLVFGFTYFYTAVIFQPNKIAENLQRQGGFIPGIRPGKQTEEYLGKVMNRLILLGALFLGVIAVLPIGVQYFTGTQSLVIGGTSLLIVVSVAIETAKQIESQLTMYEYERV